MARKVFIIVLVYRHGIHGNLVFPSYLVIISVNTVCEEAIYGICLVICPLILGVFSRGGVLRKETFAKAQMHESARSWERQDVT